MVVIIRVYDNLLHDFNNSLSGNNAISEVAVTLKFLQAGNAYNTCLVAHILELVRGKSILAWSRPDAGSGRNLFYSVSTTVDIYLIHHASIKVKDHLGYEGRSISDDL